MHLLIKGKVQGVFYRATAKTVAKTIGVTGWIKNTDEGYVEAIVAGTDSQLQKFIDWCRQGPSGAIITNVSVKEIAEELFEKFSISR